MKKKLIVGILVLTMLVACLTISASATGPDNAVEGSGHVKGNVTGEQFIKTKDAQGKITLDEDVTITSYIPVKDGNNVTVDLNSHKITREGGTVFNVTDGSLTVNGAGEVTHTGNATMIVADVGTTVTFENVTVTTSATSTNAAFVANSASTLTINGGSITSTSGNGVSSQGGDVTVTGTKITVQDGIALFASKANAKMTATNVTVIANSTQLNVTAVGVSDDGILVLNDTSITTTVGHAIVAGAFEDATSAGTLEINGNSTITTQEYKEDEGDKQSIAVIIGKSSKLTMNNGTITAPAKALQVQEKATADLKGGTIERTEVKDNQHAEPAVVVISGSTFNMTDGKIIGAEIGLQVQDNGSSATVTGGTIESKDDSGAAAVAVTDGSTFKMTAGTIKSACQGLSVGNTADGGDDDGPASATIGGTAVIDCEEKSRIGEVQVGDDGTLTIEDGAKINGSVAVFNEGGLNVTGGEITSKTGFAISTNGSSSKQAKINITGGKITGSDEACGVYLPAGTMTVSGDDTVIKGGAGIVQFGGKLEVKGGHIEATGTGNVEVGDSGTAVPAAAVTTNQQGGGYDNVEATLEGGEFVAPAGQPSVLYTDKGVDKSNEASPKLTVKGGSYSKSLTGTTLLDDTLKAELHSSDPDAPFSYYASSIDADNAKNELGGEITPLEGSAGKADIVAAGFIGTGVSKDDANKIINDAIQAAFPGVETEIKDSGENVFWAIFKSATSKSEYTVKFTKNGDESGKTYTGVVNSATKGGIVYFKPGMDSFTAEKDYQGEYKVELFEGGQAQGSAASTATIEVYKVTYKADPKSVEGDEKIIYVGKANLEAAKNAQPEGFKFANGTSMWNKNNPVVSETDEYDITVTLSAYTYVAPPMPGTPTGPDNPDNPDNPDTPVVDPAKKFVDVPS